MKNFTKITILAAVIGMMAAFQTAQAALSTTATLAELAEGGSIGIGDKTFSNFGYQQFGLTSFDAQSIVVTASIGQDDVYYLTWTGNMALSSSGATVADLLLTYVVTADPGQIVMIDQSYTGSAQNGMLAVDETVATGAFGGPIVAQSHLTADLSSQSDPSLYPSLVVNPAQSVLYVTKDIAFATFERGGFVTISSVSQSFHQTVVPEPSTVVAGALLLLPFGVSTLRILRRNKVQ
jgi:hypothetical protein